MLARCHSKQFSNSERDPVERGVGLNLRVDWEKLLAPKGLQMLPKRWVVERTFSWMDQNRRMSLGTMRG